MKKLTNNEIARAIYLSTKGKSGTHLTDTLHNVVKFLHRRRLLLKSKEILEILKKIINKEERVMVAKVSSVKKLDAEIKKDLTHSLKKKYDAKEIILEEKLNENLLGGVRIEINDEVIDLTLKNKIGQLQKYLTRTV
ncbi:F0F1 ATP synthase subunit delta [Candidatus Nomurabacteria bacterium]|nr:F0F1 ATP synthase subunit delta [Candidatus Nomurabacteria bacterium]